MPIRWYKPNGTDSEAIKSEPDRLDCPKSVNPLGSNAVKTTNFDTFIRSFKFVRFGARVTLTPWFILGLAHWTWTISLLITLRENQWAWYELVKWNDDDPFRIIPSGQFEPNNYLAVTTALGLFQLDKEYSTTLLRFLRGVVGLVSFVLNSYVRLRSSVIPQITRVDYFDDKVKVI
uniref:Uncharacterized protein n=1 Tax=Vespula pensylvanica TaxID=30213 RepID=A0A834P5V0_VESPE|nr:hypothetical protein H0235_005904 [Vespula pensylvanica]